MRFAPQLIIDMQQAKWIKLSNFFLFPPHSLLFPFSFSQDIPKDYRHVSLTGVKQRFEDDAYQHISKEKVLDFVCFLLTTVSVRHISKRYSCKSYVGQVCLTFFISWPPQGGGLYRIVSDLRDSRGGTSDGTSQPHWSTSRHPHLPRLSIQHQQEVSQFPMHIHFIFHRSP